MEGVEVSFWKSRRVFITGHTGFKGSWLALWLRTMGAEVCGYALEPSTDPSLFAALALQKEMRSIMGDIRNLAAITAAVHEFKPDVVIHMAAQPLVRLSYDRPVETYEVNVMGTVNLLEAVRRTPSVRSVVVVTSDKCYENREWVWPYRENEAMGGHDPYSSSKGCAELVTAAYRNSFFHQSATSVASARAGNVIGGGDWAADRLIPDIVRAFTKSEPVVIRNPNAVRPWQHVLEPLSGYLALAEQLYFNGNGYREGWNFGPSDADAQPVSHLVARMVELWGPGAAWREEAQAGVHEAHLLRLDSSKARAKLKWRPRWALDIALEKTIEWYREFYSTPQMDPAVRALTCAQIAAYEAAKTAVQ
ncbi:MAG: CDP-glucose 4,6-dehydratase [Acidobacteriota bacterium]|nr:CDP-glucose 4,6-dehydratase [Acidobacteriota bacterium]